MEHPHGEDIGGTEHQTIDDAVADRRKFLAVCGRFSVVTPPAITLLLSTSLTSQAIAGSGRGEMGDHGDQGDQDAQGDQS